MEFHEKIQELRKQKGLTQEELAEQLYVSRTAVSKWESGRGYPGIESLKALARFFSVTVDELLSGDQLLTIAREDQRERTEHFYDLVFGLLDLSAILLLFLPFFADRRGDVVRGVALLSLDGIQSYLKLLFFLAVIGTAAMGVLILALQTCRRIVWIQSKWTISLGLSAFSVLLFILSSQPYAAAFVFALLIIKASMLIKQR